MVHSSRTDGAVSGKSELQVCIRVFLKRHWVLLPILLVAFLLRWRDLMQFALDWDESNVLAISMMSLKDMFWFTFMHDFHPPGLHLSLRLWSFLFGGDDLTLRCFSVFWSVVAVSAGYWLAFELSKSRLISSITALFMALMPLAIRYSHFITAPALNSALVILSWVFFLKLLDLREDHRLPGNLWFWLYLFTTFWATQQYASGPYFMLFQGLYLLFAWKQVTSRNRKGILATGIGILALSIPHIWVISQPWHLSHDFNIQGLHPPVSIPFFLASPISLLFYNYDWRFDDSDLSQVPPVDVMLPAGLIMYALLGWAGYRLMRTNRRALEAIFFVGILPLLTAFILGFFGFSLFNFRSLLYAAFPFMFLLATLIAENMAQIKRRGLAICAVILIALLQFFLPSPLTAFGYLGWDKWGENLRHITKPGDGIVGYYGVRMLPIMRYYKPGDFGYSRQVLTADPRQGNNFFNQIDRIDDTYFFVTGDEVILRPQVRQAFIDFQKRHRRIIYVLLNDPKNLVPLIDCNKEMWGVNEKGAVRISCQGGSH